MIQPTSFWSRNHSEPADDRARLLPLKAKKRELSTNGTHFNPEWGAMFTGALGDPHKPGAILPSLKPFSLERFLLLRQIVVNCFNSKEINSVHLIA